MEIKIEWLFDLLKTSNPFEAKILLSIHKAIWQEVVKVIKLFVQLLEAFYLHQTHIVLVIMLDP